MSAISLKSITGITSITTPAGVDNQLTLHNNNTTEAVKLDIAGNVHVNNQLAVTGVTTFASDTHIADSIVHTGDTNTKIRFPAEDQISFETGGTNRLKLHYYASNHHVEVDASAHLSLANNGSNGRFIYMGDANASSTGYMHLQSGPGSQGMGGGIRLYSHANSTNAGGVYIGKSLNSSGAIIFGNGGMSPSTEYLRINSTGRVGINTTTDSMDGVTGNLNIANDNFNNHTVINLSRNTASDRAQIRFSNPNGNIGSINTFASDFIISSSNDLILNASSTEKVRITSSGTVNIGGDYTQTTYKAQIEATDQNVLRLVTDSDDANGVELVLRKDSASPADNDNIGNIYFQGNDDGGNATFYSSIEAYSDDVSNNSENGYIRFRTRNDGTMDERLRITSDGKIGIGIQNPVAKLHVHNSGTTAADHAYAHFTTGDTGSTISDGLTVGVAANQVASVNYREAGTLSLNTSSTPRITILSNGDVGINNTNPTQQFVVTQDGLDDNTYSLSTVYRSGNNASGYTASGLQITSSADNNNGENHTAYLQFSNRDPALNGSHGASAFITMTTNGVGNGYGNGQFDFYCRNGAEYGFQNDPAVSSGYWMSSLFRIKSSGELFGYGNLRIDTGSSADGIIGAAYGTSYFGIKQADQGASEYMMISNNSHTFISCTSGYNVYIRPSNNSQVHETVFAHDNTTFKTNVVMDSHMLRRNQHHKGHMEGGYDNIGSSTAKTSPIYTIGSSYNPNENDLNNMYGIGYSHKDASFIDSNVTGGWGLYVASDGDARIFLNGSDGRIFANSSYNRVLHQRGHLEGGHNNIGSTAAKTSPIYCIGSSYRPNENDLGNMYGVGFSNGDNASFLPAGGWGMYVASDGDARVFIDATNGYLKFNGGSGAVHFTNGSWSGEHSSGKIQTHGTNMYFQNAGGSWQFRKTNGTAAATIASNGTYTPSDLTFKKDVATISNSVDTIKKLSGRSFTWKEDNKKSFGVIAQEVETVLPELVSLTEEPEGSEVEPSKMVNYSALTGHFIEAIKELSAKLETLEQENTALKARVTTLEG